MLPAPDPELAVEHGLFSVRQAIAAGYSRADISRHVRRGRWSRLERGILIEAGRSLGTSDGLLLAVLRTPKAVVGYRSAAGVHGWDLRQEPKQPELIVPEALRRPGVQLNRKDLSPSEVLVVGLLPVTTPLRTALDAAAQLPWDEAVVLADSALRRGDVTQDDLESAWLSRRSMHGHRRARRVLDLASSLSGSVPETEMRLLILGAGLPEPVCQFVVRHGGVFVGRVDFAWPAWFVLVEVDGYEWHSSREAFQQDRDRQNRLELAGWTVLRFTVADIRDRPGEVAEQIRQALAGQGSQKLSG